MKKKYTFELQLYTYDKSYQINGYFNKIDGLKKGQNSKSGIRKIRLYKGIFIESNLKKLTKKKKNVYVEITMYDKDSKPVTTFFSGGNLKILFLNNFTELVLEGKKFLYLPPFVFSLWLERIKGMPTEKGTWIQLSRKQRKKWIGHTYEDNRFDYFNAKVENKTVEIDGNIVDDEISFYFAFGEVVRGAGGYIGSNINAFEDCLCCDKIKASTLTLIWNSFEVSKSGFYKNNEKLELKNILDVLNEQGVEVIFKF